jgi:hypothetical protein
MLAKEAELVEGVNVILQAANQRADKLREKSKHNKYHAIRYRNECNDLRGG